MESVRKINDDLAIAGSITLDQLQQVAQDGFKSVLDLQSFNETTLPIEEQQQVEALGLCYANLSVETGAMNGDVATQVLQQIDRLPKPMLIHCSNATLAAAMVLMHIAVRQGATLQQAFNRVEQLGLFGITYQSAASSARG